MRGGSPEVHREERLVSCLSSAIAALLFFGAQATACGSESHVCNGALCFMAGERTTLLEVEDPEAVERALDRARPGDCFVTFAEESAEALIACADHAVETDDDLHAFDVRWYDGDGADHTLRVRWLDGAGAARSADGVDVLWADDTATEIIVNWRSDAPGVTIRWLDSGGEPRSIIVNWRAVTDA